MRKRRRNLHFSEMICAMKSCAKTLDLKPPKLKPFDPKPSSSNPKQSWVLGVIFLRSTTTLARIMASIGFRVWGLG